MLINYKKRKCYTIMYGNENDNYANGQFVIQNCVKPRAAEIPATTIIERKK